MKKVLIVVQHYSTGGIRTYLDNMLSLLMNDYKVEVMFIGGDTAEFKNKYPKILKKSPFILSSCLTIRRELSNLGNYNIRLLTKKIYEHLARKHGIERMIEEIIRITPFIGTYDSVISFTHDTWHKDEFIGGTCELVQRKTKSINKIAFIHGEPFAIGLTKDIIMQKYANLNHVVLCSKSCMMQFDNICEGKVACEYIYPLVDKENIIKKSNESIEENNIFTITTVSRATNRFKRIDKINKIVKRLKDDGLIFKWNVIGKGPQLNEYIKEAHDLGIQDYVYYIGNKENPYPYIKNASLVVVPSDSESYSYAIQDSIVLGTPVLTTNFESAYELVDDGVNGYIVNKDIDSIYTKLKNIILNSKELDKMHNVNNNIKYEEESLNKIMAIIDS